MDIPLPDEIPLPGGVRPPRGPHPIGQGGGLLGNPRPAQILLPPGPPPGMSLPPPIFNIPPPFMTTPPPRLPGPPSVFNRMPGDSFPPPAAERYSPSRVTADDDERDPPVLPPVPSVSLPVTVPSPLTSTSSISSTAITNTTTTTADVNTTSITSTSSTDITSSTSVSTLDAPLDPLTTDIITVTLPSSSIPMPATPLDPVTSLAKGGFKTNLPKLLGKQEAKKRLLSFSGRGMKLSSFSLAKTTKPSAKCALGEEEEGPDKKDKKPGAQTKKKKKEEKVSIIEQIRNEESRLKEALGLKNMLFNPYFPGLATVVKLLDNPEELKRFETKGKSVKQRLGEYEARQTEQIRMKERAIYEKKREKEKAIEKEKERIKLKEKMREREKERKAELAGDEKNASGDTKVKEGTKRRPKHVPKSWKEFKAENFNFELLKQVRKDQFRRRSRSRSRDRDRRRRSRSTSRERNRSGRGPDKYPIYEESKVMYPVRAKALSGMDFKEYPGQLVHYTTTKPSISFSINSYRYKAHYCSRYELRSKESPEIWEIIENFWALKYKPSQERKKYKEGVNSRPWFAMSWNAVELLTKTVIEKQVQEVAIAATKSRWDSDSEEVEHPVPKKVKDDINEHEEDLKDEIEIKSEPPIVAEDEIILSENDTDDTKSEKKQDPSGKPFSGDLTEEYEAFMQMLDGGMPVKDEMETSEEKASFPLHEGEEEEGGEEEEEEEEEDEEEEEEEEDVDDEVEDEEGEMEEEVVESVEAEEEESMSVHEEKDRDLDDVESEPESKSDDNSDVNDNESQKSEESYLSEKEIEKIDDEAVVEEKSEKEDKKKLEKLDKKRKKRLKKAKRKKKKAEKKAKKKAKKRNEAKGKREKKSSQSQ